MWLEYDVNVHRERSAVILDWCKRSTKCCCMDSEWFMCMSGYHLWSERYIIIVLPMKAGHEWRLYRNLKPRIFDIFSEVTVVWPETLQEFTLPTYSDTEGIDLNMWTHRMLNRIFRTAKQLTRIRWRWNVVLAVWNVSNSPCTFPYESVTW